MAKRNRRAQKSAAKNRVGFFTDPLQSIRVAYQWDTTHALIAETLRRGGEAWIFGPTDIVLHNNTVWIHGQKVRMSKVGPIRAEGSRQWIPQQDWRMLWIRKEPPMDRVYMTALQILTLLSRQVLIWNHPAAVLGVNEKIGIASFPNWIPDTFVGSDPSLLWRNPRFRRDGAWVLKPLFYKGGYGVQKLNPGGRYGDFAGSVGGAVRRDSGAPVVVQEFVPHHRVGDKRILLLAGKILGAFVRLPKKGEFRANISLGGTTERTQITRRETEMVASIGPKLTEMGLQLVGLDVLDGRLSEVNVTCPAGIPELQHYYGGDPVGRVVDAAEKACGRFKKG